MIEEKIDDVYALSPMQAGMLFHTLYASERAVYLDQQLYALPGDLDVSAFALAWEYLIERHSVLRTSFHWEGLEEPLQVVHGSAHLPIDHRDWSGLPAVEQRAALETLLKEDRALGVDISEAPLMRVALIRTGASNWQFLWTSHHLLLDRWSGSRVLSELIAAYEALCQGRRIDLPRLRPYRDYIRWLRQQDPDRAESYWRRALEGFTNPTVLPIDRSPGSLTGKGEFGREHLRVSEETSAALQSLARQHRLTLNTLVQGAWALLLSRYSGEEDVLFGATVSGRPPSLSGVESMVGLFINSLPVRVKVPGSARVVEWLQRLQDDVSEMREYEYSSLVQIQGWSEAPRGVPLFESLVIVQGSTAEEAAQASVAARQTGDTPQVRALSAESSADFPLYLTAVPDRQLLLRLHYDTSRYSGADIQRLLHHLAVLLEGMAADPHRTLAQLPLLTEPERRQILVEWNDTATEEPSTRCVHRLFEDQVERTPDAPAVEFDGHILTYRQLNARANQLAHFLQQHGAAPDVLVGVCLERSIQMVVAILAILKAGSAYVPLDPTYPPARLATMLEDAHAPLLLTLQELKAALPENAAEVVCLDADWHEIQTFPDHNPTSSVGPDNLVYVIYTSGSTGAPKGTGVYHRGFSNLVSWFVEEFGFNAADRSLLVTSISFDLTQKNLYAVLSVGGVLHLAPAGLYDPEVIAERIGSCGITHLNCTPSHFYPLVADGSERSYARLASLRYVYLGGEPIDVGRLWGWLGHALCGAQLVNTYGPTECSDIATFYTLPKTLLPPSEPLPIGSAISNVRVYLLDAHQRLVPVGVPGEIYIGGVGVGHGYLGRSDLTAEKFIGDPFSSEAGARLYRTGDLGRYDAAGKIVYLGRIDHQVKVRGFRIELGEIESVLSGHSEVREAVVLAPESEPGGRRLVAYVVGLSGSVSPGELRDYLRDRLPEYMVPSVFVNLESLPLSPNGKVDRKALPAAGAEWVTEGYVAPRTPIEEGLCEIWCEVLRITQAGIHDSFFELGGHSLLATQVISRVRATFQVELPLRSLFEAPTIAGLAERIEEARGWEITPAPPLVRVSREGRLPLSFSQQRLWFLDQFEPGNAFYNIPMALRLAGALNVEALRRTLQEIVRRHEVLRTTFTLEDGVPAQVIDEAIASLEVADLSDLLASEREGEMRRRVAEEARRPFDLARGPLFRSSLLRLGDEEHVLLVTMHHIASDGWSMGILIRELTVLYRAYSTGQPSPLPELTLQYADYAAWQRGWLQGAELERHVGYWKEHLAGAPTLLELPTDRPRPSVQTFRGAHRRLELSEELTREITSLGQQEGATLFMTLLATFQALLSRYSGQDDIVVGAPIANRQRAEIEGLIGFFLNTLALRTDLSGDPSFRELLGRVREVCLGAYAHQDLPFEKLVDELQPTRSLSHSPICQVMLTLQNTARSTMDLRDVRVERLGGEGVSAKFDMLLELSEGGGKLRGVVEYNTDLFDEERIERLIGHFQTLLESIVADPERPLSRLSLLTEAEQRQLASFNDTYRDYDLEGGIHSLIAEQVLRTPDALALVFEEQQLTYQQLNARANRLAHLLIKHGVTPDTLVGLHAERSIEMVVGILAILKAGGAYVPFDPSYPQERLRMMVQDAQVPILLTQRHLQSSLPDNGALCLAIEEAEAAAVSEPHTNPDIEITGQHLAYMIYTSGSTGQPKGALNTHRGIRNRLLWMQEEYRLNGTDRVLQKTPFSFDVSVWEFLWPLLSGACLVVARPEGHKDPDYLVELMRSAGITTLHFVPSMLRVFLEAAGVEECVSLRRVICSGEALGADLVSRFFERSGAELHNLYGPTEAAVDVTYYACARDRSLSSVPIGRAIANTQIHILDRFGQECPIGVPGELMIGGVQVGCGYHNRVELTAEKFVEDPYRRHEVPSPAEPPSIPPQAEGGVTPFRMAPPHAGGRGVAAGARLYRTGDLARYLGDGNIEYLGRLDHQVKIRGFRIELGEIESVLLGHAGVADAVVVAREDVPGEKRLAAYVVGSDGDVSVTELREHLRSKLPDYMVPSAFVFLESLPLSPNGKVDRKALPAPDGSRPEVQSGYEAPHNPVEEALANIWAQVLHLERVGRNGNFFELGGDSILSIQIIARANAAGLRLTPRQVFQHQTIASLAAVAGAEASQIAEQGTITGEAPLTPIQHWFFEQERPEAHHFNQARLLQLRERVPVQTVREVMSALVVHHDALRLRFVRIERVGAISSQPDTVGTVRMNSAASESSMSAFADSPQSESVVREGGHSVVTQGGLQSPFARRRELDDATRRDWAQENSAEETNAFFSVVDISSLPDEEQSAAITAACSELQASLNLADGPLLRGCYFELGEDRPARLFLVIHHLAVDGVSWRVLLEDLATGIGQLVRGEVLTLLPKTTSFAGWARRLAEYANSSAARSELDYWQSVCEKSLVRLPVDYPHGENTSASERIVRVSLDAEETRALLTEVPSVYHTQVNDVLLTALAQGLSGWTGSRTLLVDLEGHGREALFEEVDLSRTVGWFTSLYPVVLELPSSGDTGESLKSVKETLRSIPNRGIGYGVLRYLSATPVVREESVKRLAFSVKNPTQEESVERLAFSVKNLAGESDSTLNAQRSTLLSCPELSFNYHGQFDSNQSGSELLSPARESAGPMHSPLARRTHLLDVIGQVVQGRLQMMFVYSEEVHARSTVERIAASYAEALRGLISHCKSPDAGGYTPSDFPKARLSRQALDRLLSAIGPIREDPIEDIYPLSPMQSGMLVHSLYTPELAVYLDHQFYTLPGDLDIAAFERAWKRLVERHAVLRTSFHWEGLEEPLQVVYERADLPLDYRDWSDLPAAEQRTAMRALITEHRKAGLDLARAPLMRLTLARTSSDNWQLIWTVHHLLLDRWSTVQMMGELAALYEGLRSGRPAQLPALRPYGDYIGWLQKQDPARAETYWRRVLEGFTSPTALPVDRSPGTVMGRNLPARHQVRLSDEASSALHALARMHRLTMNTLIQGAWALLLSRYSGEEDVLFGATVSGRPPSLSGVESMVGMFVNSLPVRVKAPGSASLVEWLQRLQDEVTEMRDYEYSSLVQIQNWSDVPAGVPLFESLVVIQNTPAARTGSGEAGAQKSSDRPADRLELRQSGAESTADFPLLLVAAPGPQVALSLNYEVSRYDSADVQRMLGHLVALLEGMAADPGRTLSRISPLTDPERHQLLVEWNDTASDYRRDRCIHQLFEEHAQRTPDAIALLFEDVTLTYAQLNARANQLAHSLRQQGVGPDTLVGLCVQRSIEMVVGMLGILKAGGAYVPLDPSYPAERLSFMLTDASLHIILTHSALAGPLAQTDAHLWALDAADLFSSESASNLSTSVDPSNLAYVVYTSGSTGLPKGVLVEHRSLLNMVGVWEECFAIDPTSRVLQFASMSFDASVSEVMMALGCGATLCLASQETLMSPQSLIALLRERRISVATLPPSLLAVLPDVDLPDLRTLASAGEVCPPDVALRWGKGRRFLNGYGPSECTVAATYCLLEGSMDANRAVPLGRAVANTRLYVLDRYGEPTPIGVPGELYIGGTGVARGYLNRPELTAERFGPVGAGLAPPETAVRARQASPLPEGKTAAWAEAGARLYRTGDLVRYRSDGQLEFVGRVDDQVKVRGFRIELGEIESRLQQHPEVARAAVIVREDEPGDARLVAYVVGKDGPVSAPTLRAFLQERLPVYMIPSAFVNLDSLPLSPNGKVDRKGLPAPDAGVVTGREIVSARNPIEEGLATIWAEVLRLPQVSVYDSFFELGGHSLLATQVISRIRNTFLIDLPLRALFDAPTIAGLAEQVTLALRAGSELQVPPLDRVSRDGVLPLSFAQQRLWFTHQLDPKSAAYNMGCALRLNGALDVGVLNRALEEIAARHEALRTNFISRDGEPTQVISEEVAFPMSFVDVSTMPEAEREEAARSICIQDTVRPFDLALDRLIRGVLVRLGEDHHILALTMHHIVSDGWSNGILASELNALYNAFLADRPSPLPELAIQYADFAAWQRGWLQGDVLERQVAYWRQRLAEAPSVLELPTDRPRTLERSYRGDVENRVIPAAISSKLRSLGREEQATQFMVLLAAFNVLLSGYTDRRDIVVGTDEAGRNHRALEGLIGFFINHLVLRTDLSGNPTFRELVRRVRETCVGAYAHQDLPFDRLVEAVRPGRETGTTPLFQVLFVMNTVTPRIGLEGTLRMSGVNLGASSSKYDIGLFLADQPSGLSTAWAYQTDLFDSGTIRGMAADFEAIVRRVAEDPETTMAELKGLLLEIAAAREASKVDERRSANRAGLRSRSTRKG